MTGTATDVDELKRVMAGMVLTVLSQDLPGSVYDSRAAADAPERYALFFLRRTIGSQRLTGQDTQADWLLELHSVGTTVDQARWVQARGCRALRDVRLSPPGWSSTPIRHVDGEPDEWDETRVPEVAVTVDVFRFRSDKQ